MNIDPMRREALASQPERASWLRPGRRDEEASEGDEDTHPSKAYGGLWNRRDRAPKLEFRFRDPERFAESLDYAWLPRVRWHGGKGLIVLLYTDGVKVTIRGINLWELKEKIRLHLVTWVQEQGDDPVFVRGETLRAREEGRQPLLVFEIRFEEPGGGPQAASAAERGEELEEA